MNKTSNQVRATSVALVVSLISGDKRNVNCGAVYMLGLGVDCD